VTFAPSMPQKTAQIPGDARGEQSVPELQP
jgi:hypothetical protein